MDALVNSHGIAVAREASFSGAAALPTIAAGLTYSCEAKTECHDVSRRRELCSARSSRREDVPGGLTLLGRRLARTRGPRLIALLLAYFAPHGSFLGNLRRDNATNGAEIRVRFRQAKLVTLLHVEPELGRSAEGASEP